MSLPRLRTNILSLALVQAGNFVVPFLALPYLARTLGAEAYGQVVWVQTVMLFGSIWVEFGFGWSATRNISAHRNDAEYVGRVFGNTWAVQWVLAMVFTVIIVAVVFAGNLHNPWSYVAGLGMVLGQALFPMWLFQGLEALGSVAVIQLLGKMLALPLLFVWVQGPKDQAWALLFFSASSLLVGVLSLGTICRQGLINWVRPGATEMWRVFHEGALLFSSRALISLYTTLIPLAVGWWAGSTQLAYFNLAERLKVAVQALLTPVSQALFPRMSWLFRHDPAGARLLARKTAWLASGLSGVAGVVLWVAAEPLMVLLGGADFAKGAQVMQWLAFVPWIVALSNLMGIQIMLPLGMNQPFTLILGLAAMVCLLVLFPVVSHGGAVGAAQLVLSVECMVTGTMAAYLWRVWHRLGER